ncbi:hypothetical protein AB0E59_06330 [Lentzea sp. NPDC034063]|uniref:hypothetical protein n=1 Tax=unclassified Lentzea TaxID=2643253 RepID=UPI0033E3D116
MSQALATGPGRDERAVLTELLGTGVPLRIAVDTPAGVVEQNAVLTASLEPGAFKGSAGGEDRFGHGLRIERVG